MKDSGERGAALVTVLLFMTLTFILITSMLAVTGNEVVISGLQRDGIRAVELAQSGLQEAVRRMEAGRQYRPGFAGSLDPSRITVTVTRRATGTNAAYQEIASDATVGRSTRRLSQLVLQIQITFPPNITFAESVTESGSARITGGDVYAETFVRYGNTLPPSGSFTYAGWRISKGGSQPTIDYCYTRPCAGGSDSAKWYPATRRTVNENSSLGQGLLQFKTDAEANGCVATNPEFAGVFSGTKADNTVATNEKLYGFDRDDPDGAVPSQLDPDLFPCGLPYKWVEEPPFSVGDGGPCPPDPDNCVRWFKKIIFEQWFLNYWRFDESELTFVKRRGLPCSDEYCLSGGVEPNLWDYPEFGAIPPFPQFDTVNTNYDCKLTGGGTVNSLPLSCVDPPSTTSDLGCKYPEMSCAGGVDRPVAVVLDSGDYTINGPLQGHGTIIINGNLTINGNVTYWGTIIVNGTATAGSGNATIHGGLVAESTLRITGNITVEGGADVSGNIPVGPSKVVGKAWWER